MPTRYDRSILQSHADALYAKADSIVLNTALSMAASLAVGGGVLGAAAAYGLAADLVTGLVLGALVLGSIGFAIGWQMGEEQAFRMRLQAQELLCQMMIEKNTAEMLRQAAGPSGRTVVQLDEATLQALRPRRSLKTRMSRLGQ
jgi:hypothetical protein